MRKTYVSIEDVLRSPWVSERPTEQKPSVTDRVLRSTRLEDSIYADLRGADEALDAVERTAGEKLRSFPALSRDVYQSFYSLMPRRREDAELSAAARKFNANILDHIIQSEDYPTLKAVCEGRELPAYEAASEFITRTAGELDDLLGNIGGEKGSLHTLEKLEQAEEKASADLAALLEQKRRLDPMLFETMYQGNPSSAEGVLYGDRFATYDKLPERTIKKGNYTDTADSGEDYLCSVCYETGTDDTIYITDVLYTPLGMEATEPLVAAMLQRNGTRTARIESNNGGRGFARAVAKLCPQTRIEWFHQYRNKEARVLSNATEVAARIRMPEDWHRRWSEFYGDVVSFRRLFRSNRRDDAPDVLTGIVETESAGPGKCIRAVGFSG